jgi:hypothetical protein
MRDYIYHVGSPAEMEHHARPLMDAFDVRIETADRVVKLAKPGDLCLFYNEFYPSYRVAIHTLAHQNCATLYAIDGILEWRSLWDFPPGISCLWSARPILCHKVACIGRSQARIMGSWGYGSRCEIVGVPRFDRLRNRTRRVRRPDEPFTILITTAKAPGFNAAQMQRAANALRDLKDWFERCGEIGGVKVQPLWRITLGLEAQIGVSNELRDTTGADLAKVLEQVDAMITTPSTSMLEGMLQGIPVALLDYNNAPHLVPAAWRITAPQQLEPVLAELVNPPLENLHWQCHLLNDALECQTPALPRMVELVSAMRRQAQQQVAAGSRIRFDSHLLFPPPAATAAAAVPMNYPALFPENPLFADPDVIRLQTEVADLREALAQQRAA